MVSDAGESTSSSASEKHRSASALFLEAADLGPEERTAFLDSRCGDDAGLRAEVERLLPVQKQLLRAGPDNQRVIVGKIRGIARELGFSI